MQNVLENVWKPERVLFLDFKFGFSVFIVFKHFHYLIFLICLLLSEIERSNLINKEINMKNFNYIKNEYVIVE